MIERPSDEAVERMVALVRKLSAPKSDWKGYMTGDFEFIPDEARAIAAMLPKPVDPAVLACREAVAWVHTAIGDKDAIMKGEWDTGLTMRCALAAYRAGQEAGIGAK